jgi:aminopeptidase N
VHATPRQTGRGRALADRTADIMRFYTSIVGAAPFPSFTLAAAEDELPGGHSPAYFAVVNHPPPTAPLLWRNDPVAFHDYAHFFLAHEIAHQWWGHGVGWKNYHEQWLSEGFAQYFAAMYAEHDRDRELFEDVLRQMRKWSVDESDQGPVYLGYRLGHIKGDARVFRALVYNKGAMVLHMLRGLIGDRLFFDGLRQFYGEWKFRKAGTADLQSVMEQVSDRDLTPFFEAWIYGSAVPELKFTSSVSAGEATLRFDHVGAVVPIPVVVTITYRDGGSEEVTVPVTARRVERVVPLRGAVRSIEPNRDRTAVAEIRR